jgi:hypothetical protein
MRAFLKGLSAWRARRKGAQIVVVDGAGELEKTQAFAKGAMAVATAAVIIAAPAPNDSHLLEEIERREALLEESSQRAAQAIRVADVCLATANNLERTLAAYQTFLGRTEPAVATAAAD